jgi:AbrB family looped-hinge helix DNA binding protein
MAAHKEVRKMPLIKVKHNYQITIPNSLRKTLNIAEGDYLEVERQDSQLILKPVKMIPTDEAYFHTKEWQKGEKQADKDRKKGDVLGPFDNLKHGLKALKTAKI